jgi:DNA-binding MarR family transcriptional regulator
LQLSPSGLTRRLDGLVQAGWVAREPSDEDRRVMLAVLTDAGREMLTRVAPHHVASVRHHLIDRLTREQLEAMANIFTVVRSGLDEDAH